MAWVGTDPKYLLVPRHCHGQGWCPLNQASKDPTQPVLENLQRPGIHNISVQPYPVPHLFLRQ